MEQVEMTRLSSRGQIVIPQELRKGLKEGDTFIVFRNGDEIIIKKAIPENLLLSHKSLARTWLSKEEDEAWKDL